MKPLVLLSVGIFLSCEKHVLLLEKTAAIQQGVVYNLHKLKDNKSGK